MTPPPPAQTSTPWHLINVHLHSQRQPRDIQSYCTTFTIRGSAPESVNLYISPFNQQINRVLCYGGVQTRIDGSTDKDRLQDTFTRRDRGAIFSRWLERSVDAIRQAPGGLVASLGNEGDFISVRNDFTWSEGTYRLCLRKSDAVDGEPLPANHDAEEIAYGWGRYEHTWVDMEATDLGTGRTTFVGALAFPGKTLSLSRSNIIFIEIYGHGGSFAISDVPVFSVSFANFQVDGIDQQYNYIQEVLNPFSRNASAPAMAQASYLRDQGVLQIDVGEITGKTGRVVTELLSN